MGSKTSDVVAFSVEERLDDKVLVDRRGVVAVEHNSARDTLRFWGDGFPSTGLVVDSNGYGVDDVQRWLNGGNIDEDEDEDDEDEEERSETKATENSASDRPGRFPAFLDALVGGSGPRPGPGPGDLLIVEVAFDGPVPDFLFSGINRNPFNINGLGRPPARPGIPPEIRAILERLTGRR